MNTISAESKLDADGVAGVGGGGATITEFDSLHDADSSVEGARMLVRLKTC